MAEDRAPSPALTDLWQELQDAAPGPARDDVLRRIDEALDRSRVPTPQPTEPA